MRLIYFHDGSVLRLCILFHLLNRVNACVAARAGELKKLLSEKTGLHPDDQKVVYKDKERDSKAFLDMEGVKDRSKMLMLEDPAAKAKRLLEERRTSKAERTAKAIASVALDVDKLAAKVRPSFICFNQFTHRRQAAGAVPVPHPVMSHRAHAAFAD